MRAIILSAALILASAAPAPDQPNPDDPKALTVLNRMADNIGALHSCSFIRLPGNKRRVVLSDTGFPACVR